LAGERGLYSVENERLAHQAGVERVVLPKSGKLFREEKALRETQMVPQGLAL
jgi:hypothetical protein